VLGTITEQDIADRALQAEPICLVQQADLQPADADHLPFIRGLVAGDQLKQRRLALAVAADHTDAIAIGDSERDVLKNRAGGVVLADGAEVDEITSGTHECFPSLQGCV
jgi:hypothetical protein